MRNRPHFLFPSKVTMLRQFSPLLVLALGSACVGNLVQRPRPADHREDDEQRHELRERWIEQMHRTAPGVDWRAIERTNQARQLAKRNAMRAQLSQPGAGLASGHAWEEVGSRNQAGHTRCAAVGPSRQGFRWLYIGSANGGLWRSPEDGSAWEPLSDSLFGGVDDVVVLEPANLNDEDILVQRRGTQLHRSDDGGLTWTPPTGLDLVTEVRRMVVLEGGAQTVLVFGLANVGSGGSSRTALYASSDEGQTFSLRWNSPTSWRGDLWTPRLGPGAGTDVYVLHNGKLRKSTDGGFTFSLVGEVWYLATEGSLQGSEAGAPHFYAAVLVAGDWHVLRSTDAGATWTDQGPPPQYWGNVTSIASFSSDPDAVFVGGVEGWYSSDGGLSWTRVNTWGSYYGAPGSRLHADLRGISPLPDPDLPGLVDRLYINTDGGTYLSLDRGQTVQNLSLSGLGVGQFYSTHTSSRDPNLIVGGTQDQGYQRGVRQAWSSGPSTDFDQLISGDYGHLNSGDGDHDYVFSTYPGFVLIQTGEQNPGLDMVDFPAGASNLWLPPVVADPLDQEDFFFLADHLWHYDKSGSDWTESLHSTRDFSIGAGSYLSALAFSPADPQRAYASDDGGRLWWSVDRGVTWTKAAESGPDNHYFYGNGLAAHPTNPSRAVVCGSGYSQSGVRHTVDGGLTWQPYAQGLPNTMAYDIAWANDGTDDLYAATEAGAWRYDSSTALWVDIMGLEAPATTYWSVEAVTEAGLMRFGTYGRGIWDYLIGGPSSAILFADDFESGDYTAGGWATSPGSRCRIKPKAARTGNYGARVKKGGQTGKATWIRRAVDTSGWNTVTVSYSRRSRNYEAHEFLTVDWFDGVDWQVIDVSQDAIWGEVSFILPPAAGNNPAFELRFSPSSKGKGEWSDLDDVVVAGSL
jgi:photosystem II stability/assembly factor-like uncharacterized protein